MDTELKLAFQVFVFLVITAGFFALFALALWWLIPLAFPAVAFNYGNALALTGVLTVVGLPALSR